MLIDTHAHLDFKEFDKDCDKVIKRAFENDVEKIINIGCNLDRSQASIDLAHKYENIFASIGVHPHDGKKNSIDEISEKLFEMAQEKKVVAIGEIGLDYYRLEKENDKDIQKKVFRTQLDIAKEFDLPVILHCRDAYEDMIDIIKKDNFKRGVSHCFLGSKEIAKRYLELGFYISFTGVITFKNAGEVIDVVREIPLERILVETDAPFLAPEPHRGKRNEPAYVKYVAEKIATIKEIGYDQVAKVTTKNAEELFGI